MTLDAGDLARLCALLIALATLVRSVLRAQAREASRFPLVTLGREWLGTRPGADVLALGVVAGFVSVVAVPILGLTAGALHFERSSDVTWAWLSLALLSVLLKAVFVLFEETIYRGSLCTELRSLLPPVTLALVSAAVFAGAHAGRSPLALAVVFVDGIGFAAAFLMTGALWLPLVWHLSKNLTVWMLYGLGTIQLVPGLFQTRYDSSSWLLGSAKEAGLAELLVTIAVVALVIVYLGRRGRPTSS